MSALTFGANAALAWLPRPGVYACVCGWQYHRHEPMLYCTAIRNDRMCGRRLQCILAPYPGESA